MEQSNFPHRLFSLCLATLCEEQYPTNSLVPVTKHSDMNQIQEKSNKAFISETTKNVYSDQE